MVKEIFKLAWDRYTLHLGGLLVTTLLMCILYLILLKLTILGGELIKPFFLYGMFNVILNYSEDNFPEIEVQVKEDDVEDFVKKIRHRPGRIDFSHFLAGFSDKHIAFKLLCYGFLKMIFLAIGFALLVVPGIYFEFATIFALPLILKKDLDIIQSFKTSIKMFNNYFLELTLIIFILIVLNALTAFPYGLFSIFTIPFSICVIACAFEVIDRKFILE
jgi:hypothetical protein